MRGKWSRKHRRRCLLIGVVLVMAAVPAGNEIARRVTAKVLGALVEGQATVGKVRFGLRTIRVERVQVWSPECDQPVFAVEEIAAKLSIIDGLRNGIWAESIVVEQPEIQLHFDEAGKLVTNLPRSAAEAQDSAPIDTLPFRTFEVKNAFFAIHQTGRESFRVAGARFVANGDGQTFDAFAGLPSFFSGRVELRSRFDLSSYSAESQFQIAGLQITSVDLVQLPLVPPTINAHPWAATATFEVQQDGSIAELGKLTAKAVLHEFQLSMTERPQFVRASGDARIEDGQVDATLAGDAIGGTFETVATFRLAPFISCGVRANLDGLRSESLPIGLLPRDVTSHLGAELAVKATYNDGVVQLNGGSTIQLTEADTFGVEVAPTTLQVTVDGGIDLSQNSDRSHGALYGELVSEGVSLEQLAYTGLSRLPEATQGMQASRQLPKLPPFVKPRGQVRATAQLKVPLATVTDPKTFLARGTVDSTGVIINDVLIRNGHGTFGLDNNRLSVDCSNVRLVDRTNGEQSVISATANSKLDAESRLHAEITVNRLAAATVARLAGVVDRKVDGVIVTHGVASCPIDQVAALDRWQANAQVQVRSVHLDDQPLAHCEANCVVDDGVLTLQQFAGEVAEGRFDGSGTLSLQTPFPFRGDGSIRHVSIDRLATFAGRSPSQVGGLIDGSVHASGRLAANQWRAGGSLSGSRLRFGSRNFDDTQLIFDAIPDKIVVCAPDSGFLGGEFGLEIHQLRDVRGQIHNLPLSAVARLVGTDEKVDGLVSGSFQANLTSDLSNVNAVAIIESSGIAVRDAALKQVRADLQLRGGQAEAELRARGLGGKLNLLANADVNRLAQLTPAEIKEISGLPVNAIAKIESVKLQNVWPIIGQQDQLRQLRGTLSATFERGTAEREQGKVAVGDIQLNELRWDNVLWSSQLRANSWRTSCRSRAILGAIREWPHQRTRSSHTRWFEQRRL